LGYVAHDDFKYDTDISGYSDWGLKKLADCKEHFNDWTKNKTNIQPDLTKTGITLATIFGSIILSHIIIAGLSNIKAKKYFLRDGKINE
jgi:hypothetical protein